MERGVRSMCFRGDFTIKIVEKLAHVEAFY